MSGGATPNGTPTLLRQHAFYAGRDHDGIVYGPRIKSWNGWPADVVEKLRELNKARRVRFIFVSHIYECGGCHDYIDSLGVAACHFDGVFLCDDCVVEAARG